MKVLRVQCMTDAFLSFIVDLYDPVSMIKLTGSEKNEARYIPPAKKKDKLLSLQMSHCLYQYYPFFFLLVFCVSFCQMEHEGEQKQCVEFDVMLYFCSYLLLYTLLLYNFIYLYLDLGGTR